MSVESAAPLRKNCTLVIKPVEDVAVAVTVCGALTPTVVELPGEVIAILGAVPPLTVTLQV